MTLTFDLRIPKCIQLFYKLLSTNWPNMREIRWKMAEKSQNAVSGKEKKFKKITKKRQYNNRKVFRRCRQTLKITIYCNTNFVLQLDINFLLIGIYRCIVTPLVFVLYDITPKKENLGYHTVQIWVYIMQKSQCLSFWAHPGAFDVSEVQVWRT